MRHRFLPLAALLLSGLPACTGTLPPPAPHAAVERHVRDELYFGMRKRDATLVTEAEWQAFVDTVVTPRFPRGLTVLTGYGQYRLESGPLVREPAKVLILIHPGGPDAERRIREISALYCRRFDQESVIRVTDRVSTEFVDVHADSVRRMAGEHYPRRPPSIAMEAAPPQPRLERRQFSQ